MRRRRSVPISVEELAPVGDMAGRVAQAIAALRPTPVDTSRAQVWLSFAPPSIADALSVDGLYRRSGTAEADFMGHCRSWHSRTLQDWEETPGQLVNGQACAAALAVDMAEAGEGDSDGANWLWSAMGPARRGNPARLVGRDRHIAHINLTTEALGWTGVNAEEAVERVDTHARVLISEWTDALPRRGSEFLATLDAQGEALSAFEAVQTPETVARVVEASQAVFGATALSMKTAIVSSCDEYEFAYDAYGSTILTCVSLDNWAAWVRTAIDSLCEEFAEDGTDDGLERMRLWMAADLMMRSIAYEVVYSDDESGTDLAAVTLAHDLLGRPTPD